MAIMIKPAGFLYRTHPNGHGTEKIPEHDQNMTACEVWTEPQAVGQIIMGSMVALPMARGP